MSDFKLTGCNFIGGRESAAGSERLYGIAAATGESLETAFALATEAEISEAVRLAANAQAAVASVSATDRAKFLESIADELAVRTGTMVERAHAETALPKPRLTGEMARTTGQLRMFARLVAEGSWVDARIDLKGPEGSGIPDIRRMLVALGPVAVFGASNFPFAFSVAGGDTASALAAGCPVVVKAHPAHPGTSELAACAILAAAKVNGMPDGIFSMLHGGAQEGTCLVQEEALEAVAFTGSLRAGRALFDLASRRPKPIPVFAEMGSINPVFLLPGALAGDASALAKSYAASLTLGVGQFCTNPGLVVGIGQPFDAFIEELLEQLAEVPAGTMLTSQIRSKYLSEAAHRASFLETPDSPPGDVLPVLFKVPADRFLADPSLTEELFGPSAIAVKCENVDQLLAVARSLPGQLTSTVHGTPHDDLSALTPLLTKTAGRIIYNGFPTGVAVCPSMQHGGPYPATTDSRSTSVGTAAIFRFARPVAYQDWPNELLPIELQDENPRNIWRTVAGSLTKDSLTA